MSEVLCFVRRRLICKFALHRLWNSRFASFCVFLLALTVSRECRRRLVSTTRALSRTTRWLAILRYRHTLSLLRLLVHRLTIRCGCLRMARLDNCVLSIGVVLNLLLHVLKIKHRLLNRLLDLCIVSLLHIVLVDELSRSGWRLATRSGMVRARTCLGAVSSFRRRWD